MTGLAPFESSIAERYHEETKYSEEALRREATLHTPLDWSEQPLPFKQLEGPRVLLPEEGLPLERRGRKAAEYAHGGEGRLDLYRLARVLWHTNGCTRIVRHGGGVHHYRAAPSAGAMYPTEVYVAVRDVEGLTTGVHSYQLLDHSLALVEPADWTAQLTAAAFGHPAVEASQAVVVLTGEWMRSAWRYRERGYRRALLDTGHVLGNLVAAAPVERLTAVPLGSFRDLAVERLLHVDGVHEGPLVIVPLVEATVAPGLARLPQRRSPVTEWRAALGTVPPPGPGEEPLRLIAALHLAGRLGEDAPPVNTSPLPALGFPEGAAVVPAEEPETAWTAEEPITATISNRRSTRFFRPVSVGLPPLLRALAYANPDAPHHLLAPEQLRTFLVAMNVEGLPAGTYVYETSPRRRLVELSRGQCAPQMRHLGLGQEIFENAAAAVIHTTDLTRAVERYGDRVYRLLGLDAGQIGERLNLALLREGLGVSGCGGYFDDEMSRVLHIPESQAVVYITALGLPRQL